MDEYARRFDRRSVASITYKPGLSDPGVASGSPCAFADIQIGPGAFAFWNPSFLMSVMGHEIHHANDYRMGITQNLESRAVKWEDAKSTHAWLRSSLQRLGSGAVV